MIMWLPGKRTRSMWLLWVHGCDGIGVQKHFQILMIIVYPRARLLRPIKITHIDFRVRTLVPRAYMRRDGRGVPSWGREMLCYWLCICRCRADR